MSVAPGSPAVAQAPLLLLRLEGGALLIGAVALYVGTGMSWWLFAALILVPDISMVGYLFGPRTGAVAYNAAHTTTLPLAMALAGLWLGAGTLVGCALIWIAHIGVDRALGFGLKYDTGFGFTHLGRVGRASAAN